MKTRLVPSSLLAPLLAALWILLAPCRADTGINFSFFYDSLDPYGEWINTPEYGYCWRPADVDPDWSPYVDGYWSYTDAGWTWVSYEDWGGICYHYGRWTDLEGEGWCWVPDYEWGPAWVSWRNNDEYVGWAPLPPEARFRRDVGFSVWTDTAYDIGPGAYRFCAVRDFGAPVVREVLIPRHRNVVIISNSYNITNICYNTTSSFVFCGGPDFTFISTRCYRPIPALRIVQNININLYFDRQDRRRLDCLNAVPRGNTLQVFAPVIAPPKKIEVLKPSKVAKVLPAAKPTGGWNILPDVREKQDLRATLAKQTNGLTPVKAPALPVKPAQLKPVPVKADPTLPTVTAPATARRPAVPLPRSNEPAQAPSQRPMPTLGGITEPTKKTAPGSALETLRKQQEDAMRSQALRQQQDAARSESLRRRQEEAMRSQTLKNQQDAMRSQALRQQQDAARSESLRRQQEAVRPQIPQRPVPMPVPSSPTPSSSSGKKKEKD